MKRVVAFLVVGVSSWGCTGQLDVGGVDGGGMHTIVATSTNTDTGTSTSTATSNGMAPAMSTDNETGTSTGTKTGTGTVTVPNTNLTTGTSTGTDTEVVDASPASDATGGGCDASVPPDAPSCFASCCTAAGSEAKFTSVDEVYAILAGRWQFCSSGVTFSDAPADAIGIEYAPLTPSADGSLCSGSGCGSMYYLVQGPSGPVRGSGFAYELTYDVSPEGTNSFQLNMHPTPNSGFGGGFVYSPCPTELLITNDVPNGDMTLVPFY